MREGVCCYDRHVAADPCDQSLCNVEPNEPEPRSDKSRDKEARGSGYSQMRSLTFRMYASIWASVYTSRPARSFATSRGSA